MAFPTGVPLVTVTCGAAYSSFGDDAPVTVEVEPIFGGNLKHLVHKTTGSVMAKSKGIFTGTPGQPATFTVPDPTQPETWVDGSGNFFSGWPYSATITIRPVGSLPVIWTKAFTVAPGQTEIDLDLIPNGQVGGGVSAPVPAVTSVNGKTGEVTIEGATPEAVDAANATLMADPVSETSTALHAAIVTEGSKAFAPYLGPIYYLDIYKDFIMGPWVTGQMNTPTTLTAAANAGTNTISVASGVNFPNNAILSTNGGTAQQQQYKITAGGGTNTLTVTPNIVTTLANGSSINTLWGDLAHLDDSAAFAYFITNSKRKDGTPVIQNPGSKPIALLGNSWFVGAGNAIIASLTAKYPGATVLNKGVNGNVSNQLLARFDTDVPNNSAYVIINEPGVNDSAHGALTSRDGSLGNLVALVAKTRAIGAIPVFIGPPPLSHLPNASLENSIWLRAVLSSPTFPDVPATAISTFLAPSATPEPASVSVGGKALDRTTTAKENTAVGFGSMLNNLTSNGNVSMGNNSLLSMTGGNGSNVAIGVVALYAATTVGRSVAIGNAAGQAPRGLGANATKTASSVVAIGYNAGASNSSDPGAYTAIGAEAIASISSVALGQFTEASGDNSTAIGCRTVASGNGSVAIGRDNTSTSASTTVNNEIKVGTALHTTKIIGRLNVAPRTPTGSADSQGAVGDVTTDDAYVYVKTSTGWKRSALTTF